MAKRKATTDTTDTAADGNGNAKPLATAKKSHHGPMASKGNILIDSHRPRNAEHLLETWLTPGRALRILKVDDNGPITVFDEVAKHDDPTALGQ